MKKKGLTERQKGTKNHEQRKVLRKEPDKNYDKASCHRALTFTAIA